MRRPSSSLTDVLSIVRPRSPRTMPPAQRPNRWRTGVSSFMLSASSAASTTAAGGGGLRLS